MKKNPITKFQDFWKTLNESEQRDLWFVLSALRGEDEGSWGLKSYTTSRLRAIVLPEDLHHKFCYGFVYNSYRKARDNTHFGNHRGIKKKFLGSSVHWRDHMIRAIELAVEWYPKKARDLKKFLGWAETVE